MRVLLAFDKFKDSMSASEACAVAASALRRIHPSWELDLCPLSDGSDGFASILTQARHGELLYANVQGPNFKPVEAQFGMIESASFSLASKAWLKIGGGGRVAVVEMAKASGLELLPPDERNLWYSSSYGTGELLKAALAQKPTLIILGLGGSATHDLGLGALEALGVRFRSESGDLIENITPQQMTRVAAIEGGAELMNLPRIILAPNVQNKLLGSRGAAALFGPQKGLKHADLRRLEEQTQATAELLLGHFDAPRELLELPGSGAAGGMSVGLMAALNGARMSVAKESGGGKGVQITSGIELADRWLRLNERIERANIIITGEGKFDRGSLEGKAPEYVMQKAANRGKRIYCFVGQSTAGSSESLPENLRETRIEKIAPPGTLVEESIKGTMGFLTEAVKRVFGEG